MIRQLSTCSRRVIVQKAALSQSKRCHSTNIDRPKDTQGNDFSSFIDLFDASLIDVQLLREAYYGEEYDDKVSRLQGARIDKGLICEANYVPSPNFQYYEYGSTPIDPTKHSLISIISFVEPGKPEKIKQCLCLNEYTGQMMAVKVDPSVDYRCEYTKKSELCEYAESFAKSHKWTLRERLVRQTSHVGREKDLGFVIPTLPMPSFHGAFHIKCDDDLYRGFLTIAATLQFRSLFLHVRSLPMHAALHSNQATYAKEHPQLVKEGLPLRTDVFQYAHYFFKEGAPSALTTERSHQMSMRQTAATSSCYLDSTKNTYGWQGVNERGEFPLFLCIIFGVVETPIKLNIGERFDMVLNNPSGILLQFVEGLKLGIRGGVFLMTDIMERSAPFAEGPIVDFGFE